MEEGEEAEEEKGEEEEEDQEAAAAGDWKQALAGAAVLNVLMGTQYLFSFYIASLGDVLGAPRAAVAAVFSLTQLCFTFTSSLGLIALGHLPLRHLAALSMVLGGGGYFLSSADGLGLWGLRAGFGVMVRRSRSRSSPG